MDDASNGSLATRNEFQSPNHSKLHNLDVTAGNVSKRLLTYV